MQQLSMADLEVLSEAMEMWENKDTIEDMAMAIGDAIFMKDKDEFELQELKARRQGVVKEREGTRKVRKERAVLIRAKLIMLKDSMAAENLSTSVQIKIQNQSPVSAMK
jgi:hypothetical protein